MFSRRSPVEVEGIAERRCSAITSDNTIRSKAMNRITFALVTALALAAITFSVTKLEFDVQANPVAEPAAAPLGDACQNVKFKFTNQHRSGGKIRFQRIRY